MQDNAMFGTRGDSVIPCLFREATVASVRRLRSREGLVAAFQALQKPYK